MSSITWVLCLILLTVLGENVAHGRHLKDLGVSDLEIDDVQKIPAASNPVDDEKVGEEIQGTVKVEDIPILKNSPVVVPPGESQKEEVEEEVKEEAKEEPMEKFENDNDEEQKDLMEVLEKDVMSNADESTKVQPEYVDQETVKESLIERDSVKVANNEPSQKSPIEIPQDIGTELEKSVPSQGVNKSRDNKVPLWYIGPVFAKESPSGRLVLPPVFSFSFPNTNPNNQNLNLGNNVFTNFIRQQIAKLQAAVANLQGAIQG